jgi:phage baseplate assembly protein W
MAQITSTSSLSTSPIYYRGFSTRNMDQPGGTPTIVNVACVNEDLLNHIYTEYYERPHMPSFGTRIPGLVFEPNDAEVQDIIRQDLTKVFNYDPRVLLQNLQILSFPDLNAIVAIATLLYRELNVVGDLNIQIYST